MRLHKEGRWIIFISLISLGLLNLLTFWYLPPIWFWMLLTISVGLLVFVLQFFRHPIRTIEVVNDQLVYAPADGKVVVIEETEEGEYFKDRRIQLSIFMSPINVHANRVPVGGEVSYYQYHAGKYLVAWHPKSSTENERTTVVINNGKTEILLRQIAGAMARRIICYLQAGQQVAQGDELGFIRFGSRVDLFLPLGTEIKVKIGDTAKGNKTVLALIKK